ncbi:MAG: EAL domain-containing protein, partial [Sulfurovum sp.]|nr:EAL domain-containing protein [Sulfurovum sp.]
MLPSQKEERERRIALALRAGVPILILIFLVVYATISEDRNIIFTLKDVIVFISLSFISIYFIYFLMNLSVKETLLDQTTQGFNKKTFIKKLQEIKPKTLAALQIRNLSSLNENYSADQIDALLYSFNKKLHLAFKQEGFPEVLIGRHSGSEFLVALDDSAEEVQSILTKMIEENKSMDNIEIDCIFAVIHNTQDDFEKSIVQLKDILVTYSESHKKSKKVSTTQDAKMLTDLEEYVITSIRNKNMLLSFRPLMNTVTNKIEIYEIAVKLKCDKHAGEILPRVFLPIVNRLGLGRDYDFNLLSHVIDLLPLVDKNIAFSFNLSPFSLRDKSFQEKVFTYLEEKKVDPSRLIIQLYERKTHHNLSGYLKTLKSFRARGIQICIDNFGSSDASMEYMKHFKFDMVQFDRDYVTDLEDKTTYAMLQSLIHMSQELEVKTVAKWVDNEKQKSTLR